MKKTIFIWIISLTLMLGACNVEPIGQYPVDQISPKEVSNPVVENLKGGANITYTLPEENDLLYVKVVYTLPNGEKKEQKASAFKNSILIRGFAKSAKIPVQLICVDRSQNESKPVDVTLEPMDSPIYDLLSSIRVIASFGGMKLTWNNPEEESIVLNILYKDDENKFKTLENIYTSAIDGNGAIRNMEPKETEIGIVVRDVYKNHTDTLVTKLTPWEETEIDKKLWRALPLASVFTISTWGNKDIASMWDGVITGSSFFYINSSSSEKIVFGFDLGQTAKLSRFKFWGRPSYYFNLHHPKEIEIWGTNDPVVANGDPLNYNGWALLNSCSSMKPSGPEPLSSNKLTAADLALATAGEEFEFPLSVPPVRYIRFRTLRTWTDSKSVHIAELSFWGSIVK